MIADPPIAAPVSARRSYNPMKVLAFPLFLVAALMLAPDLRAQSATQPIDGIVAVVDEGVILRSELDVAVANVIAQNVERAAQLPPRNVLERQVLEQMIIMRLQVDRARETGVRVSDAQLEQAMASVAQGNNMSIEQLRQRIEADGLSWEEFRNSLREEIMVQQLHQRVVRGRVAISESEVDRALELASEDSNTLYRLANILVAVPEGASSEQIQLAETKINGVKDLVDRGEMDFASAAIRYSDAGNALQGGDLEWRSLDEIPSAFAALVANMQPGDVSEPIRGPSGFQLIHVSDRREQGSQMVTQYRARGIVIRKSELVTSDQARRRVEELRARINAGEDFAEIATEHTDDTTNRAQGGDMGWFQLNDWGTGVAQQIEQLADGQVSQPFETEFGWHLIKREGTRQTDVAEVNRRNQIREMIGRRKSDEELERFVRQLRSEAYVDIRLGS
jgi:peptidyl-prolyl cis-trans isomerase SurA